jgi:hypothetical protein
MTTDDNGTSDSSDRIDLDRVIGELETEAARRRAEPGYPHDADARLHFELARRAPNPPRAASMTEIVAQVEEVASAAVAGRLDAGARPARSGRHGREVLHQRLDDTDRRVSALGLAVAGALRAVTDRLEQLEERVRLLEPSGGDATSSPSSPDDSDALAPWQSRLAESLSPDGRVLYAQTRADEVVALLRGSGLDAYGITGRDSPHHPGPDVRSGDVLAHLRAVTDDALGAVVLAGLPEAMSPPALAPLVAELGRVARRVVIVSEAPWWWRLRLGAVRADLAPGRPLDPDTWLLAFHGVAMAGTVEYDPSGHSYRVVVRARE